MFNNEFFLKKLTELNLSFADVAKAIGVSEAMVSYLSSGLKQPSLVVAYRIHCLFNCSMDDLVKGV